jgi:hypothetical protein
MNENGLILNSDTIWGILLRFGVAIFFLTILVGFIYFRFSKKEKFLFMFFLIGITVFLVSSIMKRVDIGIGLAFGLFAIFGILRLRTRNFGVKDMAYMFTVIGISVINALGIIIFPFAGIIILNLLVIFTAFFLELFLMRNMFKKHTIIFEDLDLLRPESRVKLLKELSERTGRDILRARIRKIDYKREVAELDIFFKD